MIFVPTQRLRGTICDKGDGPLLQKGSSFGVPGDSNTGAIKQDPLNRGIKHCKSVVILRYFPYNSAVFGLGFFMTPPIKRHQKRDPFIEQAMNRWMSCRKTSTWKLSGGLKWWVSNPPVFYDVFYWGTWTSFKPSLLKKKSSRPSGRFPAFQVTPKFHQRKDLGEVNCKNNLGDGFKYVLFSSRKLGKWCNLTHIFQRWVETTN